MVKAILINLRNTGGADHENFDYDRVAARSRLPGPFGGPPGRHRGAVVTGGLLVTDAGDVKR